MKVPRVGVGIMILKGNKVLLGRRHKDTKKADSELHGEGTWTCPGGKLDFGEKIVDTIKREVFEETKIKINNPKLISVTNDVVSDAHFVTLGFFCKDFEGEPKVMEPDEIIEWRWFPIDNLPKPMFFPSTKLINNYLSKTIYIGD